MLGRFAGTFLMRFVAPHRLLALYSLLCMGLLGVAIWAGGALSIYALIGVQFFMSIMFPTIFSLSIQGLGSRAKVGSSLLIMAIAGGAVFPVVMGYISDISDIRTAYIVPALCFLVVLAFAVQAKSVAGTAVATGHAHPPAGVPAGH
jgi:FHS family L-fucose permease-like MFS transporter